MEMYPAEYHPPLLARQCIRLRALVPGASLHRPDVSVCYESKETCPQAAQVLTPELPLKALLEENIKVLLRLMNARATKLDQCSRLDLLYLVSLRANGTMITFSGDTFKHAALAFIDLAGPKHNVQSLLPPASPEILEE
ncbi:hypothetical protein PF010_g2182 [Phytophthora fragariae]|nr:hypothetical protein PF009_g2744 [Phytophthora fragariae]KAE9135162.1 hypothetical protein PF010_g2182 [Phytophthora fragariae]KAE9135392.1 hypothetical protein PF007_g2572 [Phytophthora fragariae]KAE9153600.1 hypothetical protein PF006_g2301 [Phytophthora fragariae]KAE9254955.1 hypothetical protein PF002_g2608 [Phytophthora fragariae]